MEKRWGEARSLSLVAAVRQAVPPLVGGFGSLSAADPTVDGMRVSRKRVGLAVVIGAGIAVLPEETSRKLGLALSVFGVSQAMHRLSARHRNRDGAQHGSRAGSPGGTDRWAQVAPNGMALSRDASDEAVYPRIYVDRNRGALHGSARYRIAGDLDMNASWWSVTLVDEEFDPICHQAERHSFTSFNVVPTADGCRFVIDIAPDWPPGATNWLPCRRGEPFNLVWRLYLLGDRIFDRESLKLPKIVSIPG